MGSLSGYGTSSGISSGGASTSGGSISDGSLFKNKSSLQSLGFIIF